jgi:hypothetical protein
MNPALAAGSGIPERAVIFSASSGLPGSEDAALASGKLITFGKQL